MKYTVKVDKIRSYQTLVYKNGRTTFKKQAYHDYASTIKEQLYGIIEYQGNTDVTIAYYSKTKTLGDLDNITKPILDILQDIKAINNDRNIMRLTLEKHFTDDTYIEITIKEIA